jgi:hypothetical protein
MESKIGRPESLSVMIMIKAANTICRKKVSSPSKHHIISGLAAPHMFAGFLGSEYGPSCVDTHFLLKLTK